MGHGHGAVGAGDAGRAASRQLGGLHFLNLVAALADLDTQEILRVVPPLQDRRGQVLEIDAETWAGRALLPLLPLASASSAASSSFLAPKLEKCF